jgi:hypothetical protein
MIKKTITYTDYDGNERTEDFYFNLSRAELIDMNFSTEGGLDKTLEKITKEKDVVKIAEMFKKFILASYGEKSGDGKRFIKSPELTEAFSQTEAYSELYMELYTDPDAAAAFFTGVIPTKLAEQVKKLQSSNQA